MMMLGSWSKCILKIRDMHMKNHLLYVLRSTPLEELTIFAELLVLVVIIINYCCKGCSCSYSCSS